MEPGASNNPPDPHESLLFGEFPLPSSLVVQSFVDSACHTVEDDVWKMMSGMSRVFFYKHTVKGVCYIRRRTIKITRGEYSSINGDNSDILTSHSELILSS
eukprot:1136326-Pelagomonas_calceolata.AAC.3